MVLDVIAADGAETAIPDGEYVLAETGKLLGTEVLFTATPGRHWEKYIFAYSQ